MISIQISKPITSLFSLNCRMKQYQEHFRNTLIRWPTKQLVRPGERWSEFLKLSWVRGLELFTKLSLSPFLFLSIPKSLLVSCLSLPFLSLAQSLSFAVLPKQSLSISLFSFSLKNSLISFLWPTILLLLLRFCTQSVFFFSNSYQNNNCLFIFIYFSYITLNCLSVSLTQTAGKCLFLLTLIFTSFTRSLSVSLSVYQTSFSLSCLSVFSALTFKSAFLLNYGNKTQNRILTVSIFSSPMNPGNKRRSFENFFCPYHNFFRLLEKGRSLYLPWTFVVFRNGCPD